MLAWKAKAESAGMRLSLRSWPNLRRDSVPRKSLPAQTINDILKMPLTRVAIIGAGGVANALAGRLVAGGKDVCFGVRSVQSDSAKKAQEMFPNAKVITIPEAVDWCGAHLMQYCYLFIFGPFLDRFSGYRYQSWTSGIGRI
jgi:hypothetical protein